MYPVFVYKVEQNDTWYLAFQSRRPFGVHGTAPPEISSPVAYSEQALDNLLADRSVLREMVVQVFLQGHVPLPGAYRTTRDWHDERFSYTAVPKDILEKCEELTKELRHGLTHERMYARSSS